jgi:type 1 glutamine amidotransferase
MAVFALCCLAVCLGGPVAPAAPPRETRVLIVVGPSNHPPGTHEVAAGGRLMAACLENASNPRRVRTDVVEGWPDAALRAAADTVVFIGDRFPPNELPHAENNLKQLGEMMDRGCGIVCVHYATGLKNADVAADGDHPLLRWLGGYFATRCEHHQSIARIYKSATIQQAAPGHPIWNGAQPFTLHDEPYINNYFGPHGNRLAEGVTAIATAMLPPEDPGSETVAWCTEREEGGRGFGIVMPHFYRNWALDDLRRLILNGIVWTAHREVPAEGVQTESPELAKFAPGAVKP